MPFAEIEDSRSLGEPDSLYRFSMGDQVWRYTDSEDAQTVGGETYEPIPIDRDAVNTSGTQDKSALTVRLPEDSPVPMLYRYFSPPERVGLVIFQGHGGDGETLAIWVGRVLSSKVEGSEAALNCEPVSTSMKRPGLRVRDQYQCMHALYGPSCRANRAEFTRTATVVDIDGRTITLSNGWEGAFPQSKFTNGIFKFGAEQRHILRVNGWLRIDGPPRGLSIGDSVEVSLGCSHNQSDCLDLFHNIHNFGGAPFIPKNNPIGSVNNFY